MKILWLSHLLPYPPKAGVMLRSYHLLKQLSLTNEVDFLAFNQPNLLTPLVKNLESGIEDAKTDLNKFCTVVDILPIFWSRSLLSRLLLIVKGFLSLNGYTMNWLQSRAYGKAIERIIAAKKYDLIHMDTISFYSYARYFRDTPIVLDHHNIESHMMFRRATQETHLFKKFYFWLEAVKIRHVEKIFCNSIAHNITCSDIDTERLRNISPGAKISTIPNGVDTDYFAKDDSPGGQDLLFIGTMNWYPNIQAVEFLIRDISPLVEERFPGMKINIVGANAPQSLIKMAARHGNVIFHGFVDDIRPIMSSSLAFICPISDGGGTKLKILDALAMSMPIIAHPIACEGIDVVNGKNTLFAETPDDYIAAIASLVTNPQAAEHLGIAARQLIERAYSTHIVGETMRDLYNEISDLAKRRSSTGSFF